MMKIMLYQEVFDILTGKQGKLISKCNGWKTSQDFDDIVVK